MLKKTMKANLFRLAVLLVAAVMMGSVLCGCGTVDTNDSQETTSVSVSAPADTDTDTIRTEGESTHTTSTIYKLPSERLREQVEAARANGSGNSAESDSSDAEDTGSAGSGSSDMEGTGSTGNTDASATNSTVMSSVSEVAKLAELSAPVGYASDKCFVNVSEDSHNPYDVTWDYGEDYQAYVDAVEAAGMWGVLFDAEFYKENYPMLALQYHDDDALLLEHFQTVGVHEGRQASDTFNVAAYMENCDQSLIDAFGENYECYYFYWALNQESESKVRTVSDGHPLQLTVQLTALQKTELKKVNEYRAEAGTHDVVIDPEFLAFAGFRAQQDFTGDYVAHEWMKSHVEEIYEYLELINASSLSENTCYGTCNSKGPRKADIYYSRYYNSPPHYAGMVDSSYYYLGVSNEHWGPDGNDGYKRCQYDIYTKGLSTYMNP